MVQAKKDIVLAVEFALRYGIKPSIVANAHQQAQVAYVDNGLAIDVSNLQVSVDPSQYVVQHVASISMDLVVLPTSGPVFAQWQVPLRPSPLAITVRSMQPAAYIQRAAFACSGHALPHFHKPRIQQPLFGLVDRRLVSTVRAL